MNKLKVFAVVVGLPLLLFFGTRLSRSPVEARGPKVVALVPPQVQKTTAATPSQDMKPVVAPQSAERFTSVESYFKTGNPHPFTHRLGEFRFSRDVSGRQKREVIKRDGGCCLVCGSTIQLEVDHKIALMNGGDNSDSNLATLCDPCHVLKTRYDWKINTKRKLGQARSLAQRKEVMEATGWGRVWEDSTGERHIIGDLLEVTPDSVLLDKIDGTTERIALDKLSKLDRTYAQSRDKLSGTLPETFEAKVIGISEGDTVTVLYDDKQYKVRLAGIDAPEPGQAFGRKSKKHLGKLIHGKMVYGVRTDVDQYGRNICNLSCDGSRVDYDLLRNGLAWHYVKHSDDVKRQRFEDDAKAQKANLWSERGPIAPWDWRRWGDAKRKDWLLSEDDATFSPEPDYSAPRAAVEQSPVTKARMSKSHWLNTKTKSRHRASCRWFENTSHGRYCAPEDGHPCGQCGG